jgi:hypothetical protein
MIPKSEDDDAQSRRHARQISIEEKLSTLAHDMRGFVDTTSAIVEYLRIVNEGGADGLPNDFNHWAEQLSSTTHELRNALDDYIASRRQQKEVVQQSSLEQLFSTLFHKARAATNVIEEVTKCLLSIDTKIVNGLPDDFSRWIRWLSRATHQFRDELNDYPSDVT